MPTDRSEERAAALALAAPLIQDVENLETIAYPDPLTKGKPYTNGYGSTYKRDGSPWKLGEKITAKEAEDLLWFQLESRVLPQLEKSIPVWSSLNCYQQAAIISFAWNCGEYFYGAEEKDTITRCLSALQYLAGVPDALRLYVNPGTDVEEGLRRRREREVALWNQGSNQGLAMLRQVDSDMALVQLKPPQVLALQQSLVAHGFDCDPPVNGMLSPSIMAAWQKFKASRWLAQPDRIGPASIGILLGSPTNKPIAKKTFAEIIYETCRSRNQPLDHRAGATNIIGLEGINLDGTPNDDAFDRWNDTIAILTFKNDFPTLMGVFLGTTEPGRSATQNPPNPNGVARLDTGYHKQIWGKGQHRGYNALVQVGAVRLVRDRNKNASRDDKVTVETGNGINFHTTKTTGWRGAASLSSIGPWSAGCVVAYNSVEYSKEVLPMLQLGLQGRNNERFDFNLLWRDWLK